MNEKKQKVGIIGLGKMGLIRANILSSLNNIDLVGYYDIKEKTNEYKYFDNIRDLFNEIDTIFVAVPHTSTKRYVIDSLEQNKNVFSEKPPGISVNEIKNIRNAERNFEKKLKFGFNHRYHEAILKANQIIKLKEFGEILWMRGVYGRRDAGENWRDDVKSAGHGILLSQGIHLLDIFRLYMGEFVEIKSFISGKGLENNVFAILRNKGNQTASIHSSSLMFKHTFSIDIGLEKGYISINNILTESHSFGGYETLKVGLNDSGIRGNPVEHTYVYNKDDSWQKEILSFIKNIEQDRKVEWGSSYEALKNMELVEQIYNNDRN